MRWCDGTLRRCNLARPWILPGSGRTLFEGVNGEQKYDHERLSQQQCYSNTSRLTDS
jgi:hypothetical protein